jgi:phosphopantothenoylcysteine decarboxylase/phosphopantothenate--cysteine ligase
MVQRSSKKHIILGVTGSIAAYKSAEIIRGLKEEGLEVSVVMTKEAEHFITPLTLSSLSEKKVYRDMFVQGGAEYEMPHIDLARNADLVLIAPATANTVGKIAHGLADDLLTCIILATKAPVVVAPAMNTEMYLNEVVQDNCKVLKKRGFTFVEPVEGKLACGTEGTGHIACEEDIIKAVLKLLS